ncbi:MAG: PqqD family protein [Novosphingobium sp.]|nr:PqqD family protein [Novosphingobium sp.]
MPVRRHGDPRRGAVSVLARDPARYVETRIDDETVVMSLDSGDFFSLTGTAQAIWRLLDGTRDRAALLAALAAEYGEPETEIAVEVDAFLAQLDAAGLLRATP